MEPIVAKNYLKHIHRISKYFFSLNHEFIKNQFQNGKSSLINKEFNLDEKFKVLIRHPDLGHLTFENNTINLDSDIFFYLYEKINLVDQGLFWQFYKRFRYKMIWMANNQRRSFI